MTINNATVTEIAKILGNDKIMLSESVEFLQTTPLRDFHSISFKVCLSRKENETATTGQEIITQGTYEVFYDLYDDSVSIGADDYVIELQDTEEEDMLREAAQKCFYRHFDAADAATMENVMGYITNFYPIEENSPAYQLIENILQLSSTYISTEFIEGYYEGDTTGNNREEFLCDVLSHAGIGFRRDEVRLFALID